MVKVYFLVVLKIKVFFKKIKMKYGKNSPTNAKQNEVKTVCDGEIKLKTKIM